MTETSWTVNDVQLAFERRGYQRVSSPPCQPANLWYLSPTSNTDACQYLILRHLPKARAYDVMVGFTSVAARNLLVATERRIRNLVGQGTWPSSGLPVWSLFSASRAMKWESMSIPHPLKRESGQRQFEELCLRFLGPICESVTNSTLVLERLLNDNMPFEWRRGSPITRSAEVIATAMIIGENLDSLHTLLVSYRERLSVEMRTADKWSEALRVLFRLMLSAGDEQTVK